MMNALLKLISFLGLGLTVFPAFFVMWGSIRWEQHAGLMILGMLFWFLSAPFWMKKTDVD